MFAFNIWLDGKLIDTVFYFVGKKETISAAIASVRNSLINHDGYKSDIRVTWPKGQRVTDTEYELQSDYGHGFELLTTETTWKAIKQRKAEYLANSPCAMRIVKKLVRK